MGSSSVGSKSSSDRLASRACRGEEAALVQLFESHRKKLRKMIELRLDPRVAARFDPDDVLQDVYLVVRRRVPEYVAQYTDRMPLPLWFRLVTSQCLVDLHRAHLGSRKRDASLDISLDTGYWPMSSSASLAPQLLDSFTSASGAAIRAEQRRIVTAALNSMDPTDREILVLRHFEQLSNDEISKLLGLKKTAASQRYVRALLRLKTILKRVSDLEESP